MSRPSRVVYTINYTTKRSIIKSINKYTIENKKVTAHITDLFYANFVKNRKDIFPKTRFFYVE
ncbi:hypothetical protein [Clostridium puniceum]|uniref:hypothetical protein n=1 Tax=Clostridium puniceum TaxID=29367 RepID=UPI00098CD7E8|nr:hypothetical protein [Clostridium puniceum]